MNETLGERELRTVIEMAKISIRRAEIALYARLYYTARTHTIDALKHVDALIERRLRKAAE